MAKGCYILHAQVQQNREQYTRKRAEAAVPVVSLVGYTNAGKSCLLNRLTSAGVVSQVCVSCTLLFVKSRCHLGSSSHHPVPQQDALFATLDTTMRRMSLPSGLEVYLPLPE